MSESEEEVRTTEDNGDKGQEKREKVKQAPRLLRHSWDEAFSSQDQFNNLRYIVEAGDSPRDLLMRSLIPSKKTDAYRLMIGLETVLKKCVKFGDTEGEEEVRNILALLPSLDGRAREQLVLAMVGGYFGGDGVAPEEDGLKAKLRRAAFGR